MLEDSICITIKLYPARDNPDPVIRDCGTPKGGDVVISVRWGGPAVDARRFGPYPLWAADSRGESTILRKEVPAEAT